MKRLLCAAMLNLLCISTASAIEGYVIGDVELRAGPDPTYPAVAMLNDGTSVSILGCVGNWSWCDVATSSDRGWVPADFLQQEYQGQRVYVPEYGAVIGIPVVTFVFVNYWDAHYRSRPFYAQRERFISVRPQLPPPRHQPRATTTMTAPATTAPAPAGQAPAMSPMRPTATSPAPAPATTTSPATSQPPSQVQPKPATVPRTPPAATSTTTNPSAPTSEPGHRASSQQVHTPAPNPSTSAPSRAPEAQKGLPPQREAGPNESKAQKSPPPKEQGKDKEKKDNKE